MSRYFLVFSLLLLTAAGLFAQHGERYLFFLHNRFLEDHELDDVHPAYGKAAYTEILEAFEENGLNVISEKRNKDVDVLAYARHVVKQIDSLIQMGVKPQHITVVGTSKGGYIAQYVSTYAHNPKLNFVFIASFRDVDTIELPEINYCGAILTIYEESDPYGVSAKARKDSSTCVITHFNEVALHTGLMHGFIFRAMKEWIEPTIAWAKGNYSLEYHE